MSPPNRVNWSPRAFDPTTHPLTDAGNAERLIARHGHDVLHCDPANGWFTWCCPRWRFDEWRDVEARALETVRYFQAEAAKVTGDGRKELLGFALRSESETAIRRAVALARNMVAATEEEFDRDRDLLNLPNGTLYVPGATLGDHRRENRITKLAGVGFVDGAEAPKFDKFLARIMPDPEVRAFLLVLFGCGLVGRSKLQYLPILWGDGANGRSTLFRVLLRIFGDYGLQASPSLLLESRKSRGTAQPELVGLKGRRFVVAIETSQDRGIDEAIVKTITGGDAIRARDLYRREITFEPSHTVYLATNHLPTIRGTDHAIWRRVPVIRFTEQIPVSEQVDQDELVTMLVEEEGPGILNRLLRGYAEFEARGRLAIPESVQLETAAYRSDCDVLGRFIDECCVREPAGRVLNKVIWPTWKEWAEANGTDPGSQMALTQNLRRRGLEDKRDGKGRYWRGLRLRKPGEDG